LSEKEQTSSQKAVESAGKQEEAWKAAGVTADSHD
jgi:hypothetical protein